MRTRILEHDTATFGRPSALPSAVAPPPDLPVQILVPYGSTRPTETLIQAGEINATASGLRACGTITTPEEQLPGTVDLLVNEDLRFRVVARVDLAHGFLHSHSPPRSRERLGYFIVYGKSLRHVDQFISAYRSGDHDAQGKLLGYPECCRDWLVSVFAAGYIDPLIPYLFSTAQVREDEGTLTAWIEDDPYTSPLLRYWGWRTLPFFPCIPGCPQAKERVEWFGVTPWWMGLEWKAKIRHGLLEVQIAQIIALASTMILDKEVEISGTY